MTPADRGKLAHHNGRYVVPVAPPDRLPLEGETIFSRATAPDYKVDEEGCWVWQKALTPQGYPATHYAHRRYWERANGRVLLKTEHIHHACRKRACVNPEHLEAVDAIAHAIEHQLLARGRSLQDIYEIREAGKDPDITQFDLAKKYGITPNNIWYIWTARSWGHLGPPVKPDPRPCANPKCGGLIPPGGRRHRKYCSKTCRLAANGQRGNARAKAKRQAFKAPSGS